MSALDTALGAARRPRRHVSLDQLSLDQLLLDRLPDRLRQSLDGLPFDGLPLDRLPRRDSRVVWSRDRVGRGRSRRPAMRRRRATAMVLAVSAVGFTVVSALAVVTRARARSRLRTANDARALADSAATTGTADGRAADGAAIPDRERDAAGAGTVGVTEAAELLAVVPDRVRAMVDEGLLTPVTTGGQVRFARADVMALRLLGA